MTGGLALITSPQSCCKCVREGLESVSTRIREFMRTCARGLATTVLVGSYGGGLYMRAHMGEFAVCTRGFAQYVSVYMQVIPLTQRWSYHSPRGGHTTHPEAVIPLTQRWSYHSPRGSHTTHPEVVIPLTQRWSCHSPRGGHTTHPEVVIPLTQRWSYHSPRGGHTTHPEVVIPLTQSWLVIQEDYPRVAHGSVSVHTTGEHTQ